MRPRELRRLVAGVVAALAMPSLALVACDAPVPAAPDAPDGAASVDAASDASDAAADARPPGKGGCAAPAFDAAVPYRAAVLADCPIAHFTLDDFVGSKAVTDGINNTLASVMDDLQSPGNISLGTPGQVGKAVTFEGGQRDHLRVSALLFARENAFTYEVWIRPILTEDKAGFLVNTVDSIATSALAVLSLGGVAQVHFIANGENRKSDAGSVVTAALLPPGVSSGRDAGPKETRWVHLAAVYTGQRLQLYVDGELGGEADADGSFPPREHGVSMGQALEGTLDEISFYDKALTAAQVRAHFQAR